MDQSLVNSGFDVELLIGGRYIGYMLLSFSETGSLPLRVPNGDRTTVRRRRVNRFREVVFGSRSACCGSELVASRLGCNRRSDDRIPPLPQNRSVSNNRIVKASSTTSIG